MYDADPFSYSLAIVDFGLTNEQLIVWLRYFRVFPIHSSIFSTVSDVFFPGATKAGDCLGCRPSLWNCPGGHCAWRSTCTLWRYSWGWEKGLWDMLLTWKVEKEKLSGIFSECSYVCHRILSWEEYLKHTFEYL